MKLTDVLNMTATEIKAKRAECIAAVTAAREPEIAARLVQSIEDAKRRDERMGEMGREIAELNAKLVEAGRCLAAEVKSNKELQAVATGWAEQCRESERDLAAVKAERDDARDEVARLEREAASQGPLLAAAAEIKGSIGEIKAIARAAGEKKGWLRKLIGN